MKVLLKCQNGDTSYTLFDNGMRILDNHKDNEPLHVEWPLSIDLNISNYCEKGCPFCYQNCTKQGHNADLDAIKKILHSYMEVALNINMGYTIDMNFINFLEYCRDNKIIVNATINQNDLMQRGDEIAKLQSYDLIHGLGISLTHIEENMIPFFKKFTNVVFHVIAGLVSNEELDLLSANFPILILGYKQKGRAANQPLPDMTSLNGWIVKNLNKDKILLCFDNLALKQLNVKKLIPKETWDLYYQGDDGTISMYIDGVDMKFAQSSLTTNSHDIGDYNIQQMFDIVKNECCEVFAEQN